jgi:cyd operon protein YbgT
MWYFTWIIGIAAALAAGIINAMWLETNQDFVIDPLEKRRRQREGRAARTAGETS